jgi:hypothetical protein
MYQFAKLCKKHHKAPIFHKIHPQQPNKIELTDIRGQK